MVEKNNARFRPSMAFLPHGEPLCLFRGEERIHRRLEQTVRPDLADLVVNKPGANAPQQEWHGDDKREDALVDPPRAAAAMAKGGRARPPLRVASLLEHAQVRIRIRDSDELAGIALVAIRIPLDIGVVLQGEVAIRPLDFFRGRPSPHAEHLVGRFGFHVNLAHAPPSSPSDTRVPLSSGCRHSPLSADQPMPSPSPSRSQKG
mmetsp:Transcript_15708/g.40043  ORF Transcript_15708/g.40043 Transcript_15708/m.40043 type:complete len:204 (-) Transcript_15708:149-760(-)